MGTGEFGRMKADQTNSASAGTSRSSIKEINSTGTENQSQEPHSAETEHHGLENRNSETRNVGEGAHTSETENHVFDTPRLGQKSNVTETRNQKQGTYPSKAENHTQEAISSDKGNLDQEAVSSEAENHVQEDMTIETENHVQETMTIETENHVQEAMTIDTENHVQEDMTIETKNHVQEDTTIATENHVQEDMTIETEDHIQVALIIKAENHAKEAMTIEAESQGQESIEAKAKIQNTTLSSHSRGHDTDEGLAQDAASCPSLYVCTVCRRDCLSPDALAVHMKQHEEGKVAKFTCRICRLKFISVETLRDHAKSHQGIEFTEHWHSPPPSTGQKRRTYPQCELCGKFFMSKARLEEHRKVHNDDSKPHKCKDCERQFNSKELLEVHEKTHDRSGYKLVCSICKTGCANQYYFDLHMKHHRGEAEGETKSLIAHDSAPKVSEQFYCVLCRKHFRNRQNMDRHLKSQKHLDVEQKVRNGKEPAEARARQGRQGRTPSKQDYVCKECGAVFRSEHGVRSHRDTIHRTSKPCCQYCSKIFLSEEHLRCHMLLHTEKLHMCSLCGYVLTSESALKEHELRHGMSSTCKKCDVDFPSANLKKIHSDTIHNPNSDSSTFGNSQVQGHTEVKVEQEMTLQNFEIEGKGQVLVQLPPGHVIQDGRQGESECQVVYNYADIDNGGEVVIPSNEEEEEEVSFYVINMVEGMEMSDVLAQLTAQAGS